MKSRQEAGEREIFLKEVLAPVLEAASGRNGSQRISGFLSARGNSYSGGLMVVGRAPNGWDAQISQSEISSDLELDRFYECVLNSVRKTDDCELGWVENRWHKHQLREEDGPYATGRSAFWRCVRQMTGLLGVANADGPGWASHIVWSNLYKIAPAKGGNPSDAMCRQQAEGCRKLLQLEFGIYRPRRVLFLTDTNWAAIPVFDPTGLDEKHEFTHVRRFGRMHLGSPGAETQVVIASHPQGKREGIWQQEVLRAFGRLN